MSRRAGAVLGYIAVYALIWVSLMLLIAAIGIHYHWGTISVGQMLSNLVTVEFDGGGGPIVWQGVLGIGVLPVVITLAIALVHHLRARRRRRRHEAGEPRDHRTVWVRRGVAGVLVSALALGGSSAFASTVGVKDYIKAARSGMDVGTYYQRPEVTAKRPNNLVVIYLESGEQALADDELFEKNAYESLEKATPESEGWQSVEDLQQYEGGGWTMAGLVSTQCGVPLKTAKPTSSTGAREEPDENVKSYMPGATCMGDVLKDNGYTSEFMGGANTSFAAKDTFLKTHGYDSVKGLDHWRAAGEKDEDFRSDWGLSDQRLMAHAKTRVDELHTQYEQTGQPFNLTALTLDTHEPVHMYDYCDSDAENDVTAAYDCSMREVAGFVDHLKAQGHLEDTAVVIMGDHRKHMSAGDAFHEQLDNHPNRTIFNRVWIPGKSGENAPLRSDIDQLSMYPTMLEAAGLSLDQGQAGLGVSALRKDPPEDSAQALPASDYRSLLIARSKDFYGKVWEGSDD